MESLLKSDEQQLPSPLIEFAHYLNIAAGSASEVEEELLLSYDLEFLDKDSYQQLNKEVNDIKAMLNKLIETLQ